MKTDTLFAGIAVAAMIAFTAPAEAGKRTLYTQVYGSLEGCSRAAEAAIIEKPGWAERAVHVDVKGEDFGAMVVFDEGKLVYLFTCTGAKLTLQEVK